MEQPPDPRLEEWLSRVTRRRFLLGAGYVAGTSLVRSLIPEAEAAGAASLDPVANPPPGYPRAPVSFCLIGDFGAGKTSSFATGAACPGINPNAQAVAEGVATYAPQQGTAYIVSLGDQIYIPYHGYPGMDPGARANPIYPHTYVTWEAENISPFDEAVGSLYAPYIKFPDGSTSVFAPHGSKTQRFLAILGDHDWWHQPRREVSAPFYPIDLAAYAGGPAVAPAQVQPQYELAEAGYYQQYFSNQGEGSDSGNARYWDRFIDGIHWMALSSDPNEVLLGSLTNAYYFATAPFPNGLTPGQDNLQNSVQGKWFRQAAGRHPEAWRFVITHYPPYTSCAPPPGAPLDGHNPALYMQWGYEDLGVDAVFSGHVHSYERLHVKGVTYIVNGAGGTFNPFGLFSSPAGRNGSLVQSPPNTYGFLTAEQSPGRIFFTYLALAAVTTCEPNTNPPTLVDRFVFLKKGSLSTPADFAELKSIHITPQGGVLAPTADLSYSGDLLGSGSLAKQGPAKLTLLSACPLYSGMLQVIEGTLCLATDHALPAAAMALDGKGTLDVSSTAQSFSKPCAVGGFATLKIDPAAVISFSDSGAIPWTGSLVIAGSPGPQSLRFGTSATGLSARQLSAIRSADVPAAMAYLDSQGYLAFAGG